MNTIIVNRSKATRRVTKDKIELRIGANEFDADTAATVLADPYFDACRRRGIFQVTVAPEVATEVVVEPGDTVVNIRALGVPEALKAVRACDSVAQLETWLDQDGRKTVKEAILKRGIQLTDRKPAPADVDVNDADDDSDKTEAGFPIVGG
jgi:hypothetical protein